MGKTKMKYLFVIDTDSYAGNFEREMCAYLTNQIGEGCVIKAYREENHPRIGRKVLKSVNPE